MPLEGADIEAIALADYRAHGFDPRRPPGGPALARAILGKRALPRGRWRAHLRPANDGPEISVPWKLSDARYNERACHELSEHRLEGYAEPDAEGAANWLAASYAAPPPAFKRAWKKFGADLPRLAEYFVITQSMAGLRIGEVVGVSCALVTPAHIYRRGLAEVLPPDEELRAFVRSGYHPGLRLLPIGDVRRRWLVLYAGI